VWRMLRGKGATLLIVALQEAFAATVPFFFLTSLVSLTRFLVGQYHLQIYVLDGQQLWQLQNALYRFSSFMAVATIAYFYARRISASPMVSTVLSITALVTYLALRSPEDTITFPYGFAPVTLVVPVLATYLLKLFSPRLTLQLPEDGGKGHIYRHLNYLFVFVFAYAATTILLLLGGNHLAPGLARLFSGGLLHVPENTLLALYDFLVPLFWFLGIHGPRVVNSLMGTAILDVPIVPNLSFAEFNRLFVVLGGSGIGLSMLLALLLHAKNRTMRYIALVSAPFVIFNINTLIIYAIVVFNRYLLFPFVMLPLLNFSAAYVFIHTAGIKFTDHYIPWNTPAFLNGYLKTGGDWRLVAFQMLLVAANTAVYYYFISWYLRVQSTEKHFRRLKSSLRLLGELEGKGGLNAFVAHTKVIKAHAKLDQLLQGLREESLAVYYQPVLPMTGEKRAGLESLLRYREESETRAPSFLGLVEDAGMAPLIDIWVCKKVQQDLERLRELRQPPPVRINLHPDTLVNDEAVTVIIQTLRGYEVIFEIVEKSFLAGHRALVNLHRLNEVGFHISIDDFGTGYSSLDTIVRHQFYELKMDRGLVSEIGNSKGRLVSRKIVEICHGIGTQVVAEGVEERRQLAHLCEIGVDYSQGFLFAPAMPLEQALVYLDGHGRAACNTRSAAQDKPADSRPVSRGAGAYPGPGS